MMRVRDGCMALTRANRAKFCRGHDPFLCHRMVIESKSDSHTMTVCLG